VPASSIALMERVSLLCSSPQPSRPWESHQVTRERRLVLYLAQSLVVAPIGAGRLAVRVETSLDPRPFMPTTAMLTLLWLLWWTPSAPLPSARVDTRLRFSTLTHVH
jgi:hypothetical protein